MRSGRDSKWILWLSISVLSACGGGAGQSSSCERTDCGGTTGPSGPESGADGETDASPELPAEARLTIVSGSGQTGGVNETLPAPLVVRVTDASGTPLEGVEVHWSVVGHEEQGGELSITSDISSSTGLVEAQWMLGWRAGKHEVAATLTEGDLDAVVFEATATGVAGEPALLKVLSGAGQMTVVGSLFPEPVVVQVRDAFDEVVADADLVATAHADGWVVDAAPRGDADGTAAIEWYAGPRAGELQALEVRAASAVTVVEGSSLAATPGVSHWGNREFVEYIPGELPVIITAPHGGMDEPDDVADRSYGTFVRDANTTELSYAMADAFEGRDGRGLRPHLVVVHLRRTKLDANRDLEEAAQGDPLAIRAWHEYHLWIEAAKASVEADWGAGLYVDVHGHGHTIQRLELGYTLTAGDLGSTDAELNEPWAIEKSTLRTLVAHSGREHAELLRGASSLGSLFEDAGFPSVPSTAQPSPGGAPYFNGGYNTRRHGCREGGPICGVQIEANMQGVRDSAVSRAAFAEASVTVLSSFLELQYGHALGPAHARPQLTPR
mgnify:CR=1 FL=1